MNAEPRDVVVALDVGGTSMKCALTTLDGVVVHSERRSTGRDRGPDVVVDSIVVTAVELAAREGFRARAAGVVVPGVVDAARGVAVYSSNIGWRDVPMRELIESKLGLPTALGHDVRAGGMAEARLGAG
ncbi:MAG: ROK family protein, partial [Stackebrandtia sp.]